MRPLEAAKGAAHRELLRAPNAPQEREDADIRQHDRQHEGNGDREPQEHGTHGRDVSIVHRLETHAMPTLGNRGGDGAKGLVDLSLGGRAGHAGAGPHQVHRRAFA